MAVIPYASGVGTMMYVIIVHVGICFAVRFVSVSKVILDMLIGK